MDEKKTATEQVRPVSDTSSDADPERAFSDPRWSPGLIQRFPWLGFGSLAFTQWPTALAPNVILSGLNSAANIAFSIAIGNGIAIAWWRKTLKGATVEELHRSWSFSTSLKEVVMSLKYFNFIALAALTTKLTIIDSMLLQRATTSTVLLDDGKNVTDIVGYSNQSFIYTGRLSTRSGRPSMLSPAFAADLSIWSQSGGLFPRHFAGCEGGLCLLHVPGAGFEIDCSSPVTKAIDLGRSTVNDAQIMSNWNGTGSANVTSNYPLFNITFRTDYRSELYAPYDDGITYSRIIMDVLYTTSNDTTQLSCPGTLSQQTCYLRPAVINYPVTAQQYAGTRSTSGVTLGWNTTSLASAAEKSIYGIQANTSAGAYDRSQKQQSGFSILEYNDIQEDHIAAAFNTDSQLGGLLLAFQMYLKGDASIWYDGYLGYVTDFTGIAPTQLTTLPTLEQCGYWFNDPIDWLVQSINGITFSMALDLGGVAYREAIRARAQAGDVDSLAVNYNGTLYLEKVHYETDFGFMWGAFASMLVCVLCVLPTYYGYWQLGRKVTLGPFEIANAFRAPVLETPQGSNVEVDDLLKEVGGGRSGMERW
ncbi:hypothetical protein H2203_002837 [Taxawa tesnikishii (nom. ined.)]|nr:hypothetical protein H2203_002837 [Dothideales sp. JES 119]